MRIILAAAATSIFLASSACRTSLAAAKEPLVALREVTLIDMRSDKPQPHMTVVTRGNRITSIGRNATIPAGAQVVEGDGKFLIPGLWDNYTYTLDAVAKKLPYF